MCCLFSFSSSGVLLHVRTKNFVPELENEEFLDKNTLSCVFELGRGNEIWGEICLLNLCVVFDLTVVLRAWMSRSALCDI